MLLSRLITRGGMGLVLAVAAACAAPPPAANNAVLPDGTATADAERLTTAVHTALEAQAAQATAAAARDQATATAEASTAQAQVVLTTDAAQATSSMANRLATGTAGAATRVARATSTAQPLADTVQRLVSEGYLSQGGGYYEPLLDFFREWAQINWYQWYATGKAPTDFVVRAEVVWQSASDKANWFNSGCGFVFRETPRAGADDLINHYLAYLGLDGVVYMSRQLDSQFTALGEARYGRVTLPDGQANIMLAVEGSTFHFFVNDEHVLTREDGFLTSGALSYTLLSGTNRDFGTRCEMTSVGLWWLEPE